MFTCAYAFVDKIDNVCFQVNRNNKPDWIVDNEFCYNIPVSVETAEQYLDKYFYNGCWYERHFNEDGTFYDVEWSPDLQAVNN